MEWVSGILLPEKGKGIQVEGMQKKKHNWKGLRMCEQGPLEANMGGKLQRQMGPIHGGS